MTGSPLHTRIPKASREALKALAKEPEYGSLKQMYRVLFERFLREKPYANRAFLWSQPAKPNTPDWIIYNLVLDDDLSERLRNESQAIEVSLTTMLYTALGWWLEDNQPTALKGP